VFKELKSTFDWALDSSLECLTGESRVQAEEMADVARVKICDAMAAEPEPTLAGFYQRLLPEFYEFAAGTKVDLQVTATTELLKFNGETAALPRFALLDAFLSPATREQSVAAYDSAVHGSGLYELQRFGSGAIPFDLVVPGKGRGTIRIGRKGIVIMTRQPLFATLKTPIESVADLASVIERRFGPDCTLVGKAVTLIGMLAREFVFVFHEGASSYVKYSRALHSKLEKVGVNIPMNPILRVQYEAWDALQVACSWIRLPEPLQMPFGAEELCAPSLAARWKVVGQEQQALLGKLGELNRPIDLIRFLEGQVGGAWNCIAEEYEGLHNELESLKVNVDELKSARHELYRQVKALKSRRADLERQKGCHFRDHVFERQPTDAQLSKRREYDDQIEETVREIEAAKLKMRHIGVNERDLVKSPNVLKVHERRRSIEVEAELKRLRLIRNAVIASHGLANANLRPSAWWFPLLSPDGLWFRETVDSAKCYLEPLV
jgi:hypothetical protein